MEITEIIQRLKEGNNRFVADNLEGKLQNSKRRHALVGGQSPYAIILGCADSRVVPELIFDTGLGELFTVRVAGNVASSSSIASIEFAVVQLKTRVIIVLAHENCGAVAAAIDGGDHGIHMNHLLAHIPAAKEGTKNQDYCIITKKNAQMVTNELVSKSSIISETVATGHLKIFPAFYYLASGAVEFMDD
jgi:carbonic anhydrase